MAPNTNLNQLLEIFPDAERDWLADCVSQYKHNCVERITHKIIHDQHGHYPTQSNNPLHLKRNKVLKNIIERFPDVDPLHARQLILLAKCSLLDSVTDTLLKQGSAKGYPIRSKLEPLSQKDMFRSQEYIKSSQILLLNEFEYHYKSTVLAIMAECNHDYFESRLQLVNAPVSYLWTSILPFMRRNQISTNELDAELLISIAKNQNEINCKDDMKMANDMNQLQYHESGQLIDCTCCYNDVPFEDLVQCNEGHLFCKLCIENALNEGMYVQGNLRGKPMLCMSSSAICIQEIPESAIERSVPFTLYENYQATFFAKAMADAGLGVVHCPFCVYIEEEPSYARVGLLDFLTPFEMFELPERAPIYGVMTAFFALSWESFSILLVSIFFLANAWSLDMPPFVRKLFINFKKLVLFKKIKNFLWTHHTLFILNCKNPLCMRSSCVLCKKEWKPLHKCHEEAQDSMRLHVENAMSNALIRTCPHCQIRFSKVDGCNKMTCSNCKYVMCYVCRKDIGDQGYGHFCQHFRIIPGTKCEECTKCDLYQKEADQKVAKEAGENAKREWMVKNPDLNFLPPQKIG